MPDAVQIVVTLVYMWLKPLYAYLFFIRPINGTAMIEKFIAVGFSQRIRSRN